MYVEANQFDLGLQTFNVLDYSLSEEIYVTRGYLIFIRSNWSYGWLLIFI